MYRWMDRVMRISEQHDDDLLPYPLFFPFPDFFFLFFAPYCARYDVHNEVLRKNRQTDRQTDGLIQDLVG